MPYEGLNRGRSLSFREDDAFLLEREISQIKHISPEYARGNVQLKSQKNTYSVYLRGVYPVYAAMRNTIPEMGGRFLDPMADPPENRRYSRPRVAAQIASWLPSRGE